LLGIYGILLVIIRDLDLERVISTPSETYSPLFVDPDRVLSFAIPFETLKPIARRRAKIPQRVSVIQHPKFAQRDALQITGQPLYALAAKYSLRILVGKRLDHYLSI